MKIDIIIPNYNGADLIKKNLPILLEEIKKYEIDKVIISDDFSEKSDFEKLEKNVDRLKDEFDTTIVLIRNDKNLGFSSNVNKAVDFSVSDYIVLLNSDITVEANFLDAAIKDLDMDEKLFGVGFMDKSIEGNEVVLRGRGLAYFRRGFLIHSKGEVDKSDTFWISGGSSIVRRTIFKELAGFDPLYNPFYWEDIDLSYRARKSGYKILFENKSVVEHRHSEGSIKKHYKSRSVKIIAYRNQFIFVWKNISDWKLIIEHLLWMPYYFLKSLLSFDLPFFIGFYNAFIKLPKILYARKNQASLYKKNDTEILTK